MDFYLTAARSTFSTRAQNLDVAHRGLEGDSFGVANISHLAPSPFSLVDLRYSNPFPLISFRNHRAHQSRVRNLSHAPLDVWAGNVIDHLRHLKCSDSLCTTREWNPARREEETPPRRVVCGVRALVSSRGVDGLRELHHACASNPLEPPRRGGRGHTPLALGGVLKEKRAVRTRGMQS
jgi:hypothetical protein